MKKSIRMLLALLAVFSLFAAACGSDDADDVVDAGQDAAEDAADAADDAAEDAEEAMDEAMDDADEAMDDAEDAADEAMDDAEEAADDAEEAADDAMDEEEDAMADEEGDGEEAMADAPGATTVGLVYDIGGRGDLSFNDSAAAGLEQAAAELGWATTEASPNDDGSNRAELLQLAADSNDMVLAVGFLFAGDAAEAAAANPDTNFAVIDDAMMNFDTGEPVAPNAAGLTFAEEQGSFLVGAAAALKSETGKIGFIGGVCCFGLIEKFEAGFRQGALAVNPDIEIVAEYITDAPDFDGFNQPDQAQVIATTMYEDGADIIYHAAGGAGNGMFAAAKAYSEDNGTKVWGIGVDSDQYNTIGTVDPSLQEYVLTSMLKRVDVAVFEILKAQAEGTFSPGIQVYDLSVDGVGYSTSGGFVDDITGDLDAFKEQIIAGDIVVTTDPTEVGG